MTARYRGWNLRSDVILVCPACQRTKRAMPDPTDPPGTRRVVATCDRCPQEDNGQVLYFDKRGEQIIPV